ncbi:DUF305 domain-containing protein [Nocardia rhamnosiphila]|uniref:DUF305 domain-containing protein n=1 Tax=Nocardia rhamnosiphila TaxID=426716 RepID=UPI0033F22CCF
MSTGAGERRWRGRVTVLVVAVLCLSAGAVLGWSGRGDDSAGADAATVVLADSDIAFAQQMSAHHQQAVTMVDMLGPTVAPDIRAVGEQIRTAQWREIGMMTGWLELAGAPLQPPASGHEQHAGHPGMHGMASNDDLTRLHTVTGTEREVLFLQLMLRHHQGGVEMAADAVRAVTVAAVRDRALSMVNGQQQEIMMLTVALRQRGGAPLPYP